MRMHVNWLLLLAFVVNGFTSVRSQEFRVVSNRMVIRIPDTISRASLDKFLSKYNIAGIGVREFIIDGNKKPLFANGWQVGRTRDKKSYEISKPLEAWVDLRRLQDRPVFRQIATPPDWQQREGNRAVFGVNEFDGPAFTIRDSVVDFRLREYRDASTVRLAGSFTNWQHGAFPMTKTDSGWVVRVKLEPGKYYYKFIIDDNDWTTDPDNRLTENDGQGNTNSVFFVTNHVFRLPGYTGAGSVSLAGSFNEWDRNSTRMKQSAGGWYLPAFVGDGTYAYGFSVDGMPLADTLVYASGPLHRFVVKGFAQARAVTIEGNFNSWKKGGTPMKFNGSEWILDYALGPGNYRYHVTIDGQSQADSFLVIGANYRFRLPGYADAKAVRLAGDFNNWKPETLPMRREGNEWICDVYLAKGKHLYKFVVDGHWIRDPALRDWEDDGNSVLWINE